MRRSWKTSLCGIIGLALLSSSEAKGIPEWVAHILKVVGTAAPSVGLLFSRDNDKSSEDVGAKPAPVVTLLT